jgi:hypothetical protein
MPEPRVPRVPQMLVVEVVEPPRAEGEPETVFCMATFREPHPYFFPFRLADLAPVDRWIPAGWKSRGSIRGRLT